MSDGKCPNCGSVLLAGSLTGQCPRCSSGRRAGAEMVRDDFPASSDLPPRHHAEPDSPGAAGKDYDDDVGDNDAMGAERSITIAEGPDARRSGPRRLPTRLPRIDGYEPVRELGRGGQGIVYLAIRRSTKRKVAVKVLREGAFASESARRKFEHEIELVTSFKHPNIIAVYDRGCTPEGRDYYTMEYFRGIPITRYVRESKLEVRQVLELFATTCDAVNHSHQRGVIHRDLKPSNILVNVNGDVRVLDFGVAKTLSEPAESLLSQSGSVVGTLQYMSPEQTRANPDEMDIRTDVYALGVVLYESLTGKHPYVVTGDLADVIRNICEAPPEPPAKAWRAESGVRLGGDVGSRGLPRRRGRCPIDGELSTILLMALAKERSRRYDSAGQFARDIRRYLQGENIIASTPGAGRRIQKFLKRHTALTFGVSSILLVLVAAVAVTTWQLQMLREANRNAREATEAIGNFMAFGGDDMADRGDLIGARRMYTTALDEARARGLPGSSILAGLSEIGSREGGEIPILGSYGRDGGVGGFRGHSGHPNNVALLRRAHLALTSGKDGALNVWNLQTGLLVISRLSGDSAATSQSLAYVAVSADERWAVTAGTDGKLVLWNLETMTKEREVFNEPDEAFWMTAISHDGSRIIAATSRSNLGGHVLAWDAKHGRRELGSSTESIAALAFVSGSHDELALSGDGNGDIMLWDLEEGRSLWEKPTRHGDHEDHNASVNCVTVSPDGRWVASASFDGTVILWEVRGAGRQMTLASSRLLKCRARVWRAAFSPDNTLLATACDDGVVRVWTVPGGDKVAHLGGQDAAVMGAEFIDADTLVSTGDDRLDKIGNCSSSALKVWSLARRDFDLRAGPVKRIDVNVKDDGPVVVSWVPEAGDPATNGRSAELFIGEDGRLHAKGEPVGRLRGPDGPLPSWAEGGRSIAPARRPDASPGAEVVAASVAATAPPLTKELTSLSDAKVKLYGGDGTLQLWGVPRAGPGRDAGVPILLRVFQGHEARIIAAGVSPNGRYIVSADEHGRLLAWDLLRPLQCRDFEGRLSVAFNRLKDGHAGPDARSLNEWFKFRGVAVPQGFATSQGAH
jgi:serine/threonine protein kinase/WD40 repeat protein